MAGGAGHTPLHDVRSMSTSRRTPAHEMRRQGLVLEGVMKYVAVILAVNLAFFFGAWWASRKKE